MPTSPFDGCDAAFAAAKATAEANMAAAILAAFVQFNTDFDNCSGDPECRDQAREDLIANLAKAESDFQAAMAAAIAALSSCYSTVLGGL